MAQSEAAYKADMKYKAEKTKRVTLRFYPADEDVYEHLQKQPSMQGYVKRLIREDMAKVAGYTHMPEVMRNAAAAAIREAEKASSHGQEQD
jgi:hypothetical protein